MLSSTFAAQRRVQHVLRALSVQAAPIVTSNTVPTVNGLTTSYDPNKLVQDKLLFTPGPLTTSISVKSAALHDYGSRDGKFIQVIKDVTSGLLEVAGVSPNDYVCVPIQGSGTFGVESVFSSAISKSQDKGVLIIANGAYGERMKVMSKRHGLKVFSLDYAENQAPVLSDIERMLKNEAKNVSHVAVVHSETTSGIVNDVESIGQVVASFGKTFIVDAMSSFGAIPIDLNKGKIHYLISSANKCIEGLPGFSFVIAHKQTMHQECKGNASTLSLDLYEQEKGLTGNGQFRFTPPTTALLSFNQALKELKQEGGVHKRQERYRQNQQTLQKKMKELGFELYLPAEVQGCIISSYRYPTDKNWDFDTFYNKLNDRGFVIYPGKLSKADCFRIGHIGRLFPQDTEALLQAIEEVCREMKTAAFAK